MIIKEFFNSGDGSKIVIENLNSTLYGYLLDSKNTILSDVWLFNIGDTPTALPWKTSSEPPFKNPDVFVNSEKHDHYRNFYPKFSVKWANDQNMSCNIYIGNFKLAHLNNGAKPGSSVLVKKSGPLANVFRKNSCR